MRLRQGRRAAACFAALAALASPGSGWHGPGGGGQASLADYGLSEESATHSRLARRLAEISGLALTADGRLLAHHDEAAVVFELDSRTGAVLKEFGVTDGAAPIRDDFEGIAVAGERIYLVTSAGRLYEFREGADGESVLFTLHATGVGRHCEIEGLAYDAGRGSLLLLCKRSLDPEGADRLTIHAWSVTDRRVLEDPGAVISVGEVSRELGERGFRPSGIERHPDSGNYFVVAARQRAIAELAPDGRLVAVRRFPARWHRQIEGITFGPDGALIVADEGAGGRGRLTVYPAPPG